MLEIIAIIFLGSHIKKLAVQKGQPPWKYIIIMVVLWLGFEFLGAIIGVIITGNEMMAYPFALIGSVIGGYLGLTIARNAEDLSDQEYVSSTYD